MRKQNMHAYTTEYFTGFFAIEAERESEDLLIAEETVIEQMAPSRESSLVFFFGNQNCKVIPMVDS